MGAGIAEVRDYHMKRGFYTAKDTNPKTKQPVWVVIEPFYGSSGDLFFYVTKLKNGKYTLEGEDHFHDRQENQSQFVKELQEYLEGKVVEYRFIEPDFGRVYRTEVSPKPISYGKKVA